MCVARISCRLAAAWAFAVVSIAALVPPAVADVPRCCVHPRFDPVACAEATRAEHRDVLPWARVRELAAQRHRLAGVAPREDLERNQILDEIHRELVGASLRH